jgi:hypothetical protein
MEAIGSLQVPPPGLAPGRSSCRIKHVGPGSVEASPRECLCPVCWRDIVGVGHAIAAGILGVIERPIRPRDHR